MHIDAIEIYHVALPRKRPIEIAGRPSSTVETVVVRMLSGGVAGWGEASPGAAPVASEEWAAGVFALLDQWLAPPLVGAPIDSSDQLAQRLSRFRGNRRAKAAIDTAWWDLSARTAGRPLQEMLGGSRSSVEVGPSFDRMESIDEFLAAVGQAVEAGFPRIKLMFRPGWDIEMLRAVRREFSDATFHIDCEGDLGLEHMEMLCRLDDFFLAMIEQPLAPEDLVGHAMVQETVRTPVGLDESITSAAVADIALDLKSCRFISLNVGRVGGLGPALAIHDAASAAAVGCWVGAAEQSAIGSRAALALAAKSNCTYPSDYFSSDTVLADDLAEPLLGARDPSDGKMRITLWSGAGLGCEPELSSIQKYSLQSKVVR